MALKIKKNKATTPKKEVTKPVEKKETKTTRATTIKQENPRKDALEKQIEENTQVTKKSNGVEEVLKEGTPNDHFNRHQANVVGLSKGITKNMDNYESLRVDCWVSVKVKEGEDPNAVLDVISDAIDDRLELEVNKVLG